MKKIIGLDLGTTSIGWAVVNEKENENEQSQIVKLGVRVNPLTVDEQTKFEQGKAITTNADRRLKRSMRRNMQRFKLRREKLVQLLLEYGIITPEVPLYEAGPRSTFQTLRNRAKAVTDEISLDDFARVLLMINGKRGYKSNRQLNDADEGTLIDGIDVAKILNERKITPGQYLLELLNSNQRKNIDFYRSDLQEEFNRIWKTQSTYYPEYLTEDFKRRMDGLSAGQSSSLFKDTYQIDTAKKPGKEGYRQYLQWRCDGLIRQLDIEQMAYVLCNLRGAINNSGGYLGLIGDRSKELLFNDITIGQYLIRILESNPNASLKNIIFYRQDYINEFNKIWECQARFHPELTTELRNRIRNEVIFFQRPLKSCKGLVGYCELEQKQEDVTVKDGTRKVTIGSRVCPKSSPIFQEFKIWQMLNDLVVSAKGISSRRSRKSNSDEEDGLPRPLTSKEKEILHNALSIRDKMSKTEALKLLFANHDQLDLNFKSLEGNRTISKFVSAIQDIISESGHGDFDFSKMPYDGVIKTIDEIAMGMGWQLDLLSFDPLLEKKALESQLSYKVWHLLYSYAGDNSRTGDLALIKRLSELCNISEDLAKILSRIFFVSDYGNLSAKAIRKILPYMVEGMGYSDACVAAGYKSHSVRSMTKKEKEEKTYADHLDILPRNSLRNPVVEKILNQMINVVNELVATYGRPDEIRIEMARELKQSRSDREEATKAINDNTREAERIKKLLVEEFHIANPSRNDITRYRLYEELKDNGYKTLYSNTYIPREKLFSKDFDIEHIIPQARLFDDSFSNKTLEARSINLEKGNMTAIDYVASKEGETGVAAYKKRVSELLSKKAISQGKANKLLMEESKIPEDFIDRELRNSQYIARKAYEILEELAPRVFSTVGSITSRLRKDWQLENLMRELNMPKYNAINMVEEVTDKDGQTRKVIKDWSKRNDHRHHAMDALTIAFTKPSIVQYLNNLNARSDKEGAIFHIEEKELYRDRHGKLLFLPPMPLGDFRAEAKRHLEDILVSIKAKNKVMTSNVNKTKCKGGYKEKVQMTPRGALHQETVYGKILQYETEMVKVGGKMTEDVILRVCNQRYRKALLQRLENNGNDAKKAFTGKNALDKKPIYLNVNQTEKVPEAVKTVKLVEVMTTTAEVGPDLKVDKVIDKGIKRILENRLSEYGGDAKKAFTNLHLNPIWQNKEKGIAIKRVKVRVPVSADNALSVREKRDISGQLMRGVTGGYIPTDFVKTGSNHHVAIFKDSNGDWQEHVVSFFEATATALLGLPIVNKEYRKEDGWQFLFSMKQNEYFVFPNERTGFNPSEIDLLDPANYTMISPNLFRVQTVSSSDYRFRHHLETNVEYSKALQEVAWKRISTIRKLSGAVKVRVNHIGQIVSVGEY